MTAIRRNRLFWVSLFLVLALAAVYGAFFYLYRAFRSQLDQELGARLVAVATAGSAAVNGSVWEGLLQGDPGTVAAVRGELGEILAANDLSNIFLFDAGERTVLDLRGQYPVGEENPALGFDVVAVTNALAGLPAYTVLYESGGIYLKSAYAPILDGGDAVRGGMGVEASAGFFAVLDRVRSTLLGAGGAVLAAMALLGLGFARVQQYQGRLEGRLRRTETLATLGQMTAMMAHEIRNPLGIIRGAAETLGHKYGMNDDEVFRFIPEEVDRLHRTLTAYLEFARPGDGEERVEDLGEALRRTVDLVRGELERRGIVLAADVPEGRFPVRAASQPLQQVFLNLVLNSRDALPEGGTLTVDLERSGGEVRVRFADNGMGMSPEVLARATEPFFTRKEKGSGLGLAVVRRVVEESGGTIGMASRPGRGTTVTLTVPLVPSAVSPEEAS